jgi:DNA-binding NtrC family response regulator
MAGGGKKNILAVDDNITTLAELRTILQGSFEVHLAKNAELAKKILHTVEIDVILLDLEMPGLSGMEFLDAIHNNTSFYFIPIIIVSSHGTGDFIVKAKMRGASDFVVKPVNHKTLLEKIYSVLKLARKKASRETLARKLNILETACTMGISGRIVELVAELEQVYCEIAIDLEIVEICKNAKEGNYKDAAAKIGKLIKNLNENRL